MQFISDRACAELLRTSLWIAFSIALGLAGCTRESQQSEKPGSQEAAGEEDAGTRAAEPRDDEDVVTADVTAVRMTGQSGAYTFSVTLRSPDSGCNRYADWWEVVTPNGELIYRRILAHSHVDEQPFTRSGGPVRLEDTTRAIVRGHMNDGGYGGVAFSGSPAEGFAADATVTSSFASELGDAAPQPTGCAF